VLEQLVDSLGASATLSVIGPFLFLLICGLGLPIPEDLVLITAGILAAREGSSFLGVSILMYFGIILGDSLVYLMGAKIGLRALKTKLGAKLIGQESVDRASTYIRRWGSPILFVARFMPGLRSPIFFTAGMLGFRYYRFLLLDSIAAIASAPLFVWLGFWGYHRFQDDFSEIENKLTQWQPILLTIVAVSALVVVGVVLFRRKIAQAKGTHSEKPQI
jgi:membrane protein DedA with SNARE-associated domain